jgi:hypothetical protein
MEHTHLMISSSIRKLVLGSTKEVGTGIICNRMEGRTTGTYVLANVDCPTCKARLAETRLDLLEQFVQPDERQQVTEALAAYGFMVKYVTPYSEHMLILHGGDGESVYVRRVVGIEGGEMMTRRGLTVKNGDLWVEWFRGGEVLGSQLVRKGQRWMQK